MGKVKQLVAVTMVMGVCLTTAAAAEEAVRDAEGRVIGYLDQQRDKTTVRDCGHRLLGHTDSTGTYDKDGKKVYTQAMPDLLLQGSECMKALGTGSH